MMSIYELTQYEMHGRRLGAIKASKYRSQRALAADLGVEISVVNKVITGERTTWWLRAAIAHRVGMPFAWMWGEEPTPPPNDSDAQALSDRAQLVYCARAAAVNPIIKKLKCHNCRHHADCRGDNE